MNDERSPVDLDRMEVFIASELEYEHYQRVKPMLAEIRELRATAPELLEVLREARERMLGNSPAIKALREKADAAIAKAEGRS